MKSSEISRKTFHLLMREHINVPSRELARKISGVSSGEEFERIRIRIVKFRTREKKKSTFDNVLEENNLDEKNWKHGWVKTKTASVFVRNEDKVDYEAMITSIFESLGKPKKKKLYKPKKSPTFDRLIITDVHIGMDPDKNNTNIFKSKWGVDEIEDAFLKIIESVTENAKSDVLYIDNLGDYIDGYEGQTTRGGHSLDQNLSSGEQFKYGIEMMIMLLESVPHEKIIVHNVCNDNHAGSFAEILGIAMEKLVQFLDKDVTWINQVQFIDHYEVGENVFILSHGKDKKYMKHGLKPAPTKDNVQKIENYIFHKGIDTTKNIEFSKGDSHLYIVDYGSSDIFKWSSYPTLAPNSEYVTTNFKKGRRGFVFQTLRYDGMGSSVNDVIL